MTMTNKKWEVVNAETEISVEFFATREEAEAEAADMSAYHGETYIARERTC